MHSNLYIFAQMECWNFSGKLDIHKGFLICGDCPSQCSPGAPRPQPRGAGTGHRLLQGPQPVPTLSIYYLRHRWARFLPGILGVVLDPTVPTEAFLFVDECQISVFQVGAKNKWCHILPSCLSPTHLLFFNNNIFIIIVMLKLVYTFNNNRVIITVMLKLTYPEAPVFCQLQFNCSCWYRLQQQVSTLGLQVNCDSLYPPLSPVSGVVTCPVTLIF